jgi:hypothetical protein
MASGNRHFTSRSKRQTTNPELFTTPRHGAAQPRHVHRVEDRVRMIGIGFARLLTAQALMVLAVMLSPTVCAAGVGTLRSGAQPASSYEFEDLAVTRLVSDGKPTSGFTSYYRLNRALPFAPRGKFEGEEEGGPRLYAAYLSVDGIHEEGGTEAIGDEGNDAGRHCYAETIEVHSPEHQPRIGEVVNVSLVVKGRRLLTVRTRISNRKFPPTIREPDGLLVTREALPYEKAFGCLKMSPGRR